MHRTLRSSSALASLLLGAVLTMSPGPLTPTALAQVQAAAEADRALADLSSNLWKSAKSGDSPGFKELLERLATDPQPGVRAAAAQLSEHIAQREATRTKRLAEVREELDKHLAGEQTDVAMAKALRSAIEMHTLSLDKAAVLAEPRVRSLMDRADIAARAAESRGDILTAGELMVLMDLLTENSGHYRPDVKRIGQRQEMLRLYVPERMWELRNQRKLAEDGKPLPPYNAFGDNWTVKLESIDRALVERAIAYSARHVEKTPTNSMLVGALEAVRTMATTQDLRLAFPGLNDDAKRDGFVAGLEKQIATISQSERQFDAVQVESLINAVAALNQATVGIPETALLHEFGNGAMSKLDDFSEVIWPDEVRRFNKNTQGRFVGVGIQIEYDELQNIRVISPLEGTPAQRAGVHPGDIISKVDGRNIFGLTLDQAVDVITGPENTKVTLTIERKKDAPEGENAAKESIDFSLKRSVIRVPSVKGWRRTDAKEDAWDWFIDPDSRIGYLRLAQFSETTDAELGRAAREMQKDGIKGLILDLRFNPGGLLDQAVRVSQRFLNVESDFIVMTQDASGRMRDPEFTDPRRATFAGVPLVVLVNEGSASASEIVSGAIATYARQGKADAIVLGERSYGKGSVQNVWPVRPDGSAIMKLTTAYYMLPDRSIIHRRPGAEKWGVEPDMRVEMLPKQTSEAILKRRDADVLPLDENGLRVGGTPAPNPDELITTGLDLQLETALLLLRGRAAADAVIAQSVK